MSHVGLVSSIQIHWREVDLIYSTWFLESQFPSGINVEKDVQRVFVPGVRAGGACGGTLGHSSLLRHCCVLCLGLDAVYRAGLFVKMHQTMPLRCVHFSGYVQHIGEKCFVFGFNKGNNEISVWLQGTKRTRVSVLGAPGAGSRVHTLAGSGGGGWREPAGTQMPLLVSLPFSLADFRDSPGSAFCLLTALEFPS